MVIDHGKLIALLVQKTGRDKEQVEKQLSRLKSRLRKVKETGEAFEIEGFGIFSVSDGAIDFEPSEQLSTEINQKYAGMKPIELIEAFKETGAGVPVEETSEPPSEPEPVAESGSAESAEQEEKFPPEESEETEKPVQEQQDEAPPVIASEAQQKEPDQPAIAEEEENMPPADEADTAQEAERDEPEITEQTEEPPKKRKKVAAAYGNGRNDGNIGKYLIAAVILIGLIAGGWALYESGFFAPSETEESGEIAAADTTSRDASKTARDDTVRAAGPAADTVEQNVVDSVSQENAASPEIESGIYGLKGEATEVGQNGYTIVIHSFRLQSTVQEIADSLDQRGYRTVLFQGSPTVDSRWRLGLGQFETVESAQQAVPHLSEQYRNNHFIKRIQ